MPRTKKKTASWSITEIYDGVADGAWITVGTDNIDGLLRGDWLLIDRKLKRPRLGDFVVWIDEDGEPEKGYAVTDINQPMYITVFEEGDGAFVKNEVYGIGV